MNHLVARFYDHPKLNVEESKKAGSKQYDPVIMVELKVRGERNESVSKLVYDERAEFDEREYYKEQFPGAWANYRGKGDGGFISGTLLTALDIDVGERAMLEAQSIRTVEELAELNDTAAQKIRGGMTLKTKAMKFVKAKGLMKDGNVIDLLESLQKQVADLQEKNEELAANQKKSPGRPKKVDEPDTQAAM